MKTVSAGDANRHFSQVLRRAASGETVTITSRGRAVARLGPAGDRERGRSAAREMLLARLRRQRATGRRDWKRDDLYEDRG